MPYVREALMIQILPFSGETQDKKPSGTILYFMEQTLGSWLAALDAIQRSPPPVSHFISLSTQQLFDTILWAILTQAAQNMDGDNMWFSAPVHES